MNHHTVNFLLTHTLGLSWKSSRMCRRQTGIALTLSHQSILPKIMRQFSAFVCDAHSNRRDKVVTLTESSDLISSQHHMLLWKWPQKDACTSIPNYYERLLGQRHEKSLSEIYSYNGFKHMKIICHSTQEGTITYPNQGKNFSDGFSAFLQ